MLKNIGSETENLSNIQVTKIFINIIEIPMNHPIYSLGDPSYPEQVSSLLTFTNQALISAARRSFQVSDISFPPKPKTPQ